jgi:hypothetical protein
MNEINQNHFNGIEVPSELEEAVQRGINHAQPMLSRRNKIRFTFKSMSAAAVLLLTFVTTMNISPAFAQTVTNRLPLLSALVIASNHDQGLGLAIKNDYVYQSLTQVTDNGVTFTVQDIIADEKQITLSYKLIIQEGHDHFANIIPRRILISYNGKEEQMDFTYQADNPQFAKTRTMEGVASLKWDLEKGIMPNNVAIYTDELDDYSFFLAKRVPQQVIAADKETSTYKKYGRAPFTVVGNWSLQLDLSGFKALSPRVFKNITAETEIGAITLSSVEVAPTQVKVIMDGGVDINKVILESDKIQIMPHLEDGNGAKYQVKEISAEGGLPVFSFESSYFSESKDLYFVLKDNRSPDSKTTRIKID